MPNLEKLSQRITKFWAKTLNRDCNVDLQWWCNMSTHSEKRVQHFLPPSNQPGIVRARRTSPRVDRNANPSRGPELFQLFEEEPRGGVSKVRRHSGCCEDIVPLVQMLVDVAKFLGVRPLAEQVIEVPKMFFHFVYIPQSTVLLEPHAVDQLVEVPSPSFDTVQQRTVMKIVDISRTVQKQQ